MARKKTRQQSDLEVLEYGPDAAVDVSSWARYLVTREASEAGVLTARYAAKPELASQEEWAAMVRATFGSLYQIGCQTLEPEERQKSWVGVVLDQAEQVPAWQRLVAKSEGDPWACGIAASEMISAMEPTILELLKEREDNPEQAQAGGAGNGGMSKEQVAALKRQLTAGAQRAQQAQQEAQGDVEAFGKTAGQGLANDVGVDVPPEEIRQALAKSPKLREIAKMVGRARAAAKAAQRARVRWARSDVFDVGVGDDLQRLLTQELVALTDPDQEVLAFRRLLERQCLQYELRGNEWANRGPMVVLLDESGSMSGAPHNWAMAVSLGLLAVCANQGRPFVLAPFCYGLSRDPWEVPNPRRLDFKAMADHVCRFSGGGTDVGLSIKQVNERFLGKAAWKTADVMVISDGYTGDFTKQIQDLKNKGVRVFGVGIGSKFGAEESKLMAGVASVSAQAVSKGDLSGLADVLSVG
jgi:uncharacterized protein with von Willebrand factor type A (vWA) domain